MKFPQSFIPFMPGHATRTGKRPQNRPISDSMHERNMEAKPSTTPWGRRPQPLAVVSGPVMSINRTQK
jgi:hypothetical protein